MSLTFLDHDEMELCVRLGTTVAEVCRDEVFDELPSECPLTIESVASIAEDAAPPSATRKALEELRAVRMGAAR